MEEQRKRSRNINIFVTDDVNVKDSVALTLTAANVKEAAKQVQLGDGSQTRFVGYETLEERTRVIFAQGNVAVLEASPLYAESGGQVGDTGTLEFEQNRLLVLDTVRGVNANVLVLRGSAEHHVGKHVFAQVEKPRRLNIQRNHSATHLVHEALRRVLGTHVHQQGSLVAPDHLRFDFPHLGKITPEAIKDIEDMVNEKIAKDIKVETIEEPIEKARKIPNVMMFFGDKYGDTVRVVFIDENFSVEFCGGTHVKNTKDIGLFKIVSESSIASGVRRIEAVTGEGIKRYIDEQLKKVKLLDAHLEQLIEESDKLEREMSKYREPAFVHARPSLGRIHLSPHHDEAIRQLEQELVAREQAVEVMAKRTQDLKKDISKHKVKEASHGIDGLVDGASSVNGFKVVSSKVEASTMDELKSMGDALRSKLGSGVGVLASVIEEKVAFVCVVTDDLIKTRNLQAGKIVGEMAKQVGGGGGGRPHLATAGGKDVAKLDEALRRTSDIVQEMLKR